MPLCFLSDRLGSRKAILFPAVITGLICIGLIPVVEGGTIWVLMIVAGVFMDVFMSLSVTMLLETKGVGPVYSGTALGILFTIVHIGNFAFPPLGNSLADINMGLPFIFWASLIIIPVVTLPFIKETGWRRTKNFRS